MRRIPHGWMRRAVVPAFVVGVVGCTLSTADAPPEDVARTMEAVGEPMNGFPTADERLMIMAINRGRSDPATVKGPMSTVYPARPPVAWSYDLSRSARFHATNLFDADVTLMHTSPCTLNTDVGTSGCDGSVACACASAVPTMCAACANQMAENSCGTAPFTRIGYFTSIANGEVAAAGYSDTFAAVNGWLDEQAGSDGHRTNLLDQGITSNTMGAGHVAGKGACYSSFDISDSGMQKGLTIPQMPSASIQPVTGSASTMFTFYATWADPSSKMGDAGVFLPPKNIDVVLDGACVPLALELGNPSLNSTWKASSTLTPGCHNYYFVATDWQGNGVKYPTTGSLNVSVTGNGATACAADYDATPTTQACPPGNGGGGPMADAGAANAGGDGGGSSGSGTSGTSSGASGTSGSKGGSGASSSGASGAATSGTSGTASGGGGSGTTSGTGSGTGSGTSGTGGASGTTAGTAGGGSGSGGSAGSTALKGDAGTEGGGSSSSKGCSVSAAPGGATGATGAESLAATPVLFALLALRRRRSARTPT